MDDVYAVVLKESPVSGSDFIWRCKCGATGRGTKSEAAHNKKTKHSLSEMQTYVPSQKLFEIAEALDAERKKNVELESRIPPEGKLVISEQTLREIVHAAIDSTFVEDFEVSLDAINQGDTLGAVLRFQAHVLWNETWWAGFQTRLHREIKKADPNHEFPLADD